MIEETKTFWPGFLPALVASHTINFGWRGSRFTNESVIMSSPRKGHYNGIYTAGAQFLYLQSTIHYYYYYYTIIII